MANLTLHDLASSVTCDILTPLDPSIPMQSRNLRGGPAWDFSNLFNASPPRLPDCTARGSLGNAGRSMFRTMTTVLGGVKKEEHGRTTAAIAAISAIAVSDVWQLQTALLSRLPAFNISHLHSSFVFTFNMFTQSPKRFTSSISRRISKVACFFWDVDAKTDCLIARLRFGD